MVSKTLAAVTAESPVQRFPDLKYAADIMNNYLVSFAMDAGFALDVEEDMDDDGRPFFYLTPSTEDCILAARQTVTVAAVLADLCRQIGIKPPAAVTAALTDPTPY